MNFLQLAQDVRLLGGVQGNGPTAIATATGYENNIVHFVRDAWIDLQLLRDDWNFMQRKYTFTTVSNQDNYAIPTDYKRWKKNSFTLNGNHLIQYDPGLLEDMYANTTTTGKPGKYAVEADHTITLKTTPNAVYTIKAKYYKSPQILLMDAEEPLLPQSFHKLISYMALEKLDDFFSTSKYTVYRDSAIDLTGELLRAEIPSRRVKYKAKFV